MKRTRIVVVVALLLLAVGADARAQSVGKTSQLSAGGKTIGGPSAFNGVGGTQPNIFAVIGGTLNVCVTIANLGTPLAILFDGGASSTLVAAGGTKTACRPSTGSIAVDCDPGKPCKFLWRVDNSN